MASALHDERLIRREILRVLDINYDNEVNVETISMVLMRERYVLTDQEIRQHLAYLADKGYVQRRDLRHGVLGQAVVAKLTAAGKDLIEGNVDPDPGICTTRP